MTQRNLFLFSCRDNHAITLTSEFRHRFGAEPGDMDIYFYDWDGGPEIDPATFDFPVIGRAEGAALGPGSVRSAFLCSLIPSNAAALRDLAARTGLDMEKVCVFVTDDEVERWSTHLATHGGWTPGVQDHIDEAVIEMVGRIRKYLCPYEPFGRMLEGILGPDTEILDIPSLPPVVTDPVVNAVMADRVRPNIEAHTARTRAINVMVMTKPRPWPAWRGHMRALLRYLLTGTGRRDLGIYVWRRRARWPLSHRIEAAILFALIAAVSAVNRLRRRPRADIRWLSSLTREEYLMTIYRCHALIGPSRSGGGAMAEFLRNGKLVFFPEGSVNALVNQKARSIDTPPTGPDEFHRLTAMISGGQAETFGTTAADGIRRVEETARARFATQIRRDFWGVGPDT